MAVPTVLRLIACGTALLPLAALATEDDLRKCRTLAESAARLACYDAIALPAPGSARAPAPAKETPAQFGLVGAQRQVSLDAVDSRIPGNFDGWTARSRITLENGQVWQIDDDSRAILELKNPKARVRKGALGAFYLEVEGTNRSPRVKRVQ